MTNDSIDHVAEQQYRKDRRSLSFSHAQRYHRSSTSSSDEEEGSPVRNIQWFNNEDDEASRDSLSEFQELDVDDDETQQGK
jgi:hypothetical protein